MSNENLITFLPGAPVEHGDEIIYKAMLGDREIRAAISRTAFEALQGPQDASQLDDMSPTLPVHGEAQAVMQRKLDLEGLDASGGILVTEEDLVTHNGLNE